MKKELLLILLDSIIDAKSWPLALSLSQVNRYFYMIFKQNKHPNQVFWFTYKITDMDQLMKQCLEMPWSSWPAGYFEMRLFQGWNFLTCYLYFGHVSVPAEYLIVSL